MWADILDASGDEQGPGPLHRISAFSMTHRLSRAGTGSLTVAAADGRPQYIDDKYQLRVRQIVDEQVTDEGTLIVDRRRLTLGPSPTLTIEGDDLLRELTYRIVGDLRLSMDALATPANVQYVITDVNPSTELANTTDGNAGTFDTVTIDIGPPLEYLYVGHPTTFDKVILDLGAQVNNNSAALSAQYFNGEGWVTLTITDGTAFGPATLAVDGTISWTRPADEATVNHEDVEQYWIRFYPSALLDAVDINEVTIEAESATDDALDEVMAFAPSGWTWGGTMDNLVFHQFGGETVLEALVKLAEMTGENFRLGFGREIVWLGETHPDSLVRLIQDADPIAVADNLDVALITSLEMATDTYEQVTRVYPYGAGSGDERLSLASTTETAPAGYTLDANANYIERNGASPAIYRRQVFGDIGTGAPGADETEAANQLFRTALAWLKERDTVHRSYVLSAAGLRQDLQFSFVPGNQVRVEYRGVVEVDGGDFTFVDIDETLVILEVTTRLEASGDRTHVLTVATTARAPATNESAIVALVQQVSAVANSYQPQEAPFLATEQVTTPLFRQAGGRPDVTGSRGGNAALANLLSALAALDLITDSTT